MFCFFLNLKKPLPSFLQFFTLFDIEISFYIFNFITEGDQCKFFVFQRYAYEFGKFFGHHCGECWIDLGVREDIEFSVLKMKWGLTCSFRTLSSASRSCLLRDSSFLILSKIFKICLDQVDESGKSKIENQTKKESGDKDRFSRNSGTRGLSMNT